MLQTVVFPQANRFAIVRKFFVPAKKYNMIPALLSNGTDCQKFVSCFLT